MEFVPINIEKKILLQLMHAVNSTLPAIQTKVDNIETKTTEQSELIDESVDNETLKLALFFLGTDNVAYSLLAIGNPTFSYEDGIWPTEGFAPNVFNVLGTLDSTHTIQLANSSINSNVPKEYMFQFDTGNTIPTIIWPNTIMWVEEPNIEANHRYQVSILNNVGLIVGVELT